MTLDNHKPRLIISSHLLNPQPSQLHPLYLLLQLYRIWVIAKPTTSISISKFILIRFSILLTTARHRCFVAIVFTSLSFICCVEHRVDFELSLCHVCWRLYILIHLFWLVCELLVKSDVDIVDRHGGYVLFLLFLTIFLDPSLVHHHLLLLYHLYIFFFELNLIRNVVVHMFQGMFVKGKRQELLKLDSLF